MSRTLFRLLFILLPCLTTLTLILFGINHISAQNDKNDNSILIKILIDQAIQSFQNNKSADSISHLHAAYDELVIFAKMNDRNIVNARALGSTIISTLNSLSEENKSHYASATNNNIIIADFNALEDQVGRDLLYLLSIPNSNLNNAILPVIPTETFLIYHNDRYGASVQYPSNWSIRIENDSNLQQYKPDHFKSKVIASFYVPRLSSGLPIFYIGTNSNLSKRIDHSPITLKNYLDLAVKSKNLTNFPNLKIISSSLGNINNKNILSGSLAYKLVWTYVNPIYGLRKVMEFGTLIGKDTGYFIDYSASIERFNDYLPLVQKMKDTFVS